VRTVRVFTDGRGRAALALCLLLGRNAASSKRGRPCGRDAYGVQVPQLAAEQIADSRVRAGVR
jgi:hypothetical protein